MILVLYTNDHAQRAIPLAQMLGARYGEIHVTNPAAIPGLDTITLWGHGDPFKLCEHTASDLAALLRKWKSHNPGLKTVEILTCNARHATGNMDPIADQLRHKLHVHRMSTTSTRDITVKGLPVAVGGKLNAWSILLAEPVHRSWVYVTAPGANDTLLMEAQGMIRFDPSPSGQGMVDYKGDMAVKADRIVRENPNRQWTMNYGYFNTLRSSLGKV